MDKIKITDLVDGAAKPKFAIPRDRSLVPWKKKKRESLFASMKKRFLQFVAPYFAKLRRLKPVRTMDALRNINMYRKLRERLVRFYIRRTIAPTSVRRAKLMVYWQPVPLIIAKVALAVVFSFWFYGLAPFVGKWLKIGFDFFKLQDIYKFEFPKQSFFDAIAGYAILFVIAYVGLWFLYHQLVAFLSVLVVNETENRVYVVRNVFVKKTLYAFSIADIALVVLRQNMFARLFGIGSISLEKKSGELVEIKSIAGARNAVRLISGTRGKAGESAYGKL